MLQSVQSEPRAHDENSAPGPPSSQSPSAEWLHVSMHVPDDEGAVTGDGGVPLPYEELHEIPSHVPQLFVEPSLSENDVGDS